MKERSWKVMTRLARFPRSQNVEMRAENDVGAEIIVQFRPVEKTGGKNQKVCWESSNSRFRRSENFSNQSARLFWKSRCKKTGIRFPVNLKSVPRSERVYSSMPEAPPLPSRRISARILISFFKAVKIISATVF